MAFKRQVKDLVGLEEKRKNQIVEDIKERKRSKKMNELMTKIAPEIREKNKGKFIKWLRMYKEAYGKKGVEFLLEQTRRNVVFGKQFVNKYNKISYEFDCYLYQFLKELKEERRRNQGAMLFLDNIFEFENSWNLDSYLIRAMAQFKRYIQIPSYSEI